MKRIVLVGAGHAHLAALRSFVQQPLYGARVVLVTPNARQIYSGMLPGLIAGHYALDQVQVDVAELCRRSFAEYIEGTVVALDPEQRMAQLADGRTVEYDVLSINAARFAIPRPGRGKALPVKPFELHRQHHGAVDRVAVGAGAAGCGSRWRSLAPQ